LLVVNLDWSLQQFDVKNSFHHGDLGEEVYMETSLGLQDSSVNRKVCKLTKVLYGLKKSPRAWFERFAWAKQKCNYKQSQDDHTLFIKRSLKGKVTVLIVYVDGIILTRNGYCTTATKERLYPYLAYLLSTFLLSRGLTH